jgi:hypothetical protein
VYVRSTEGAHRHLGCANFLVHALSGKIQQIEGASVGCRPAASTTKLISVKIRTHASVTHQPD